ncbi:TraB/GumN family protein [Qipengyuania sediminis]|uniref:TraB/GumN family protein n=1 Tax=Qipengyuania sediminis TaxID=1532023 RepID=UPI001059F3F9|nr:TraB/GumN family protein [Qipengyuania sediminis]
MTKALLRPLAAAALALSLASCAALRDAPAPAAPANAAPAGPALWRFGDADTTIYLFGTVHALPKDTEWYRGPVAAAVASSRTLVTEIPMGSLNTPEVQKVFLAAAALPEGQSLRALLTAEQRAAYEAALGKLALPVSAFDRFEPWFAALMLATVPILKAGYTPEAGVEMAVEAKLSADVKRQSLETVEEQLELFDGLPQAAQIAYMMSLVEDLDRTVPSMNAMVAVWAKGDAEELAQLMNEELDDPALADRLLYARNRNWAEWLAKALAEPGTMFVAVGAGHLAGENSVQDYLGKRGLTVTRVQ